MSQSRAGWAREWCCWYILLPHRDFCSTSEYGHDFGTFLRSVCMFAKHMHSCTVHKCQNRVRTLRARIHIFCACLYSTCAFTTYVLAVITSTKFRHVVLTCLKSVNTLQSMYLYVRYTHTGACLLESLQSKLMCGKNQHVCAVSACCAHVCVCTCLSSRNPCA